VALAAAAALLARACPKTFAVVLQAPPPARAQKGAKAQSIAAAEQRVEELRALSMEACILADEDSLEAVERCQSLAYDLQDAEAQLLHEQANQGIAPLSALDSDSY